MCIIISKDKGVAPLSADNFERAWEHNSDGGGVVWREPTGEVKMQKGIMEKETFLKLLEKVNTEDRAYIAHFRIRSVGPVVPSNCHPFVMDKVTFAHNGTITSLKPFEGKTDSETFGLSILKDKSLDWIKENQLLLELALGTSKFAIMDNETGEIFILNKEYGKERDGCWFSNTSADKPQPVQAYRSNYYDYSYPYSGQSNGTSKLYGRTFFGTKKFTEPYHHYSKDEGCWVTDTWNTAKTVWFFKKKVVFNHRGLMVLYKDEQPVLNDKAKKKTTGVAKDKITRTLARYAMRLEQGLAQYRISTYSSEKDREGAEDRIHALNLLLDASRKLIRAGYELNEENLTEYLINGVELDRYFQRNPRGLNLQTEMWYWTMKFLDSIDGKGRLEDVVE